MLCFHFYKHVSVLLLQKRVVTSILFIGHSANLWFYSLKPVAFASSSLNDRVPSLAHWTLKASWS